MKNINDLTLRLQVDEKPNIDNEEEEYIEYGDDYDPYVEIYMFKEGVFNLEEWADIDTFDDETRELMKLYSTSYKIKVFADGWENEQSFYDDRELNHFSLKYDEKCDYLKFVKDLNRIKSSLTRDYVFSAYRDFVKETFLTDEINENNGYKWLEY